ncbi:MAG: Maf family protein [Gammaproteobacteria bacterium]
MQLVLASSSRYRRALLEQLRLPFVCASPDVDETPQPDEAVADLVARLALAKARALAARFPDALIIGSDQACSLDGRILGKPGDASRARAQLQACSGRRVTFHTGLVLYDTRDASWQHHVDTYAVRFRELAMDEIVRYVEREQPFDCAGSFKVEGLGIALFSALEGSDYNSLIGLPLISLCTMLRAAGVNPLGAADALEAVDSQGPVDFDSAAPLA